MMSYLLEGDLLEVCNCNVLCPCWIGEDPDLGYCESSLAYRFNSGHIDGVDVFGLAVACAVSIPGNVLNGNWRRLIYVDDRASDAQMTAIIEVLTGKKGGPLADLAGLVGEEVGAARAAITFDLDQGKGTLRVGDVVEAVMEPYRGASGAVTTLNESIFSTIPGSPAYVSRAETFKMKSAELGLDVDLENHNAIQGSFRFEH